MDASKDGEVTVISNIAAAQRKGIVAVDFDETLAEYNQDSPEDIGPPLKGALEAMQFFHRVYHWDIVVWTCRENLDAVQDWLFKHSVPYNSINECLISGKVAKPIADVYIDNRDIHCIGDGFNWAYAMERFIDAFGFLGDGFE